MFQNRAQLLTKRCAGPASSPGRCTCGLALPLLVTFSSTGLEGSLQEARERGRGVRMGTALLLQTPETSLFIVPFIEAGETDIRLSRVDRDSWKLKPASQPFSGTFWTLKLIVSSEGRVMSIFHVDTQELPTCLGIACSKEVTVDTTHLPPAHRELSVRLLNCLWGSTV